MKTRISIRRAAASAAGLAAALALGTAPAHADGGPPPSTDANVIRSPQVVMVLADGESGSKRPV
ncbi:hypothetical protein [Nonomuraea basaltis]|uniref:hypothetical protein n=1 Tax=Nonomuraea basaltis TaxID=2495887 RepID=UPI00110C5D2E|nr:hypothetical protein [Nonomuraea basaltis]TMR97205.1 hypothetical protein EJK15_19605 [Nonomuraea basaltis]